jgi:hypothetical protein
MDEASSAGYPLWTLSIEAARKGRSADPLRTGIAARAAPVTRRLEPVRAFLARHARGAAFGAYLVLGLLTAGWFAIQDPSGTCACIGNSDPAAYEWSLGWWPHAIEHGLNPFFSHYVWSPVGDNLARHATIPAAALAMWPITALFGPIVSYNVLSIGSPVLAAFTAYLLCRRLVRRELPALVGGFLFGFGPYMFAQLVAHLNLTLVFLIPLMVLVPLKRVEREISRRMYVIAIAAMLAVQIGFSTEVLATALVMGAVLLISGRLLAPRSYGERIDDLVGETALGALLAVVVTSPFLYYALIKGGAPHELPEIANEYGLDLLNPIFPTHATWLFNNTFEGIANTFEGANIAEADGYLSLPLIIAFVLWFIRARRQLLARLAMIIAVFSFIAALGAHLHVEGASVIPLPYNLIRHLPVVRLLTPSRIAMYTLLAVAVGVAAWLAERPRSPALGAGRWILVIAGVALMLPNIGSHYWGEAPANPAFFRNTTYRQYIKRGDNVLVLPFSNNGNSLLWQAETGFYFGMPEGYLGHYIPSTFEGQMIVGELGGNHPVSLTNLASYLNRYGVREIVVAENELVSLPLESELVRLGMKATSVGGVTVFRVPPTGVSVP